MIRGQHLLSASQRKKIESLRAEVWRDFEKCRWCSWLEAWDKVRAELEWKVPCSCPHCSAVGKAGDLVEVDGVGDYFDPCREAEIRVEELVEERWEEMR